MFAASAFLFAACEHSADSKLVGSWQWKGCDDAGDVAYRADHSFTSRDWAVTYSHQPPIVADTGEWHIKGNRLIMDLKGDTAHRKPDTLSCRSHFSTEIHCWSAPQMEE